jgi:choline dehydrogenase-like flavoprotein
MYVGADPEDTQPLIDWGIDSEPVPGAGGRVIHYAQGKTLGGSSARNQMIYHRCVFHVHKLWGVLTRAMQRNKRLVPGHCRYCWRRFIHLGQYVPVHEEELLSHTS